VLIVLYERLTRPADVLRAAEEVEALGIVDAGALASQARALKSLGRAEEAARLEARLARMEPRAVAAAVKSPLLARAATEAQSSAAAPPSPAPAPQPAPKAPAKTKR